MMKIEHLIKKKIIAFFESEYKQEVSENSTQIQETHKEFPGDITIVVFPFLKITKTSPENTGYLLGSYLKKEIGYIAGFNVTKGFLNLEISTSYWLSYFNSIANTSPTIVHQPAASKNIVIEYSSPNTNKPLHLGHIRNNLLGYAVANILKANGHKVSMVNLVNDRGIHVCKSMLAWQKWGNNETPGSTGIKGDHLVGKYYVKFDTENKREIEALVAKGVPKDQAVKESASLLEAQEMLRKWEAGDKLIKNLWEKMNAWVYAGFDETYKRMGVNFDKIYYESETYQLGKKIILDALQKGILIKKGDGAIWADLTKDGLDEKILLRSDGTSVYMTQDIGTANLRYNDYHFDEHVYVVGNEQNYHFQALSIIINKLGFNWAKNLKHLSYGMVELPEGKMKSREGNVVDADDLMDEMIHTAREMSKELGKLEDYSSEEKEEVFRVIGMGALKYFILKVDPKKNMIFNPSESIDFNGNTGPFIQYTYARIKSLKRKAVEQKINVPGKIEATIGLNRKELQLIKFIYKYSDVIKAAGENYSPALIANYIYELTKEFNQFYHDYPILKEENKQLQMFRLILSDKVGELIKNSMALMGIEVPERM